ncbi:hypothetical protein VKT23_008952 [Stygiomarasmius scandens]|uniref:Uncharacterized protein n=1 Tax=Marasmiellus scandens TaxID=2682957 RepID=A0ABR1JIK6_9AGAR
MISYQIYTTLQWVSYNHIYREPPIITLATPKANTKAAPAPSEGAPLSLTSAEELKPEDPDDEGEEEELPEELDEPRA